VSRWPTIKGTLPLSEARKQAKVILGEVAKGHDPVGEKKAAKRAEANSFQRVAEDYLAEAGDLRSISERRRVFETNIFPTLGHRPMESIKRSDIITLLNTLQKKKPPPKGRKGKWRGGPVAAEHAFKAMRKLFRWYEARHDDDDYRSPFRPGMWSPAGKSPPRDRVLSDDELRVVWKVATEAGNVYGHLIRFLLLTATRLREASDMNRSELSADGTEWVIPPARYKGKHAHLVPLSKLSQEVLAAVPVIGARGWVFTTNGEVPILGFAKFKTAFDRRVLEEMRKTDREAEPLPRWTTHDLRRTARTIMSREHLNILSDHAERALGHVIGGIRATYDLHEFKAAKRDAFEKLAAEVERIINPPADNVERLRRA
jgi:Phage integrase family